MSWSLSKIVGLVLIPLLVAATILGAYQSIRSGPLENKTSRVDTILDKEARNMDIGEGVSRRVAAAQFKDLIIYNQISAVNCNLFYYMWASGKSGPRPGHYVSKTEVESKIDDDKPDKKIDRVLEYAIAGRPTNRDERAFSYLAETEYVPSCVGTSNNVPTWLDADSVRKVRNGKIWNPVHAAAVPINAIADLGKGLWNAASCKWAPGWAKTRGNDMEGKYGKTTFEAKKTFFIGKYGNGKVWAVQTMSDACDHRSDTMKGPEFWAGKEWMNLFPYPQGGNTPSDLNYFKQASPFNDPHNHDAISDAMVKAPAITTKNLAGGEEDSTNSNWFPWSDVFYVVCKGAKGYIQTNANKHNNVDESTFRKEDNYQGDEINTYTYIKVQSGGESCLKNTFYDSSSLDHHGSLGGKSCDTFNEATKENRITVQHNGDTYVCGLIRFRWNSGDGDLVRHIYQIGWTKS